MSSDGIMSFEEFIKKLKQENINMKEVYDIIMDNSLLTYFYSMNYKFKFKFVKNEKSKSILSSNFSQLDQKNEDLINEKNKEYDSLYDSKENNSNTNIININNSQSSNNSINNSDKTANMLIGKNLLCLFKNKLMMICSFLGKNENNYYYNIKENIFFKFYKIFDEKVGECEIFEINKYNNLKRYISEKSILKKNKSPNDNNYMILLNKEKFDSLDGDFIIIDNLISNKNNIKKDINITNNLKINDLKKEKNNNNSINIDIFAVNKNKEQEKEKSEEINLLSGIREENINNINNINNNKKEMNQQNVTPFGNDSFRSKIIKYLNNSENNLNENKFILLFNIIIIFLNDCKMSDIMELARICSKSIIIIILLVSFYISIKLTMLASCKI